MLSNSPPDWKVCDDALAKFVEPTKMGFTCGPGDLHRFRARYRVAKSFTGMHLETYSQATVDGYSALFRLFLTYSAFEQFMDCCGLNLKGMLPALAPYDPAACEASVRAVNQHEQFLDFVLQRLDRKEHQDQFAAFLSKKPFNVLYLPAGIRHIFAHGILTPNAGAGFAQPAIEACNVLVTFLFAVMDGEFTARLKANKFI
jgi:hypothetical protein